MPADVGPYPVDLLGAVPHDSVVERGKAGVDGHPVIVPDPGGRSVFGAALRECVVDVRDQIGSVRQPTTGSSRARAAGPQARRVQGCRRRARAWRPPTRWLTHLF